MKTLHGISSAGVIKVCKPCSLPSSRAESPSIVTYSSIACEHLFHSLCLWSSLDTLLLLYSLMLSLSVVSDPLRPHGPEPGSFPVFHYFFSKLKYGTAPAGMAPLTTGLSQHLDHCHQSSDHADLCSLSVYPSRLRYVLWPQGLWPLAHSSTDTGESTQWIWTASLPVQALTSAHSLGALRGVGSVGASQELPAAAARGQDLNARERFHGWLWNSREINSSLKVGTCSKGCRANWKALIPAMELLCLMRSRIGDWFYLEFAEHLVHLKDCPEIWSHRCFHLDEAAPLVCTSHPGEHCLLELANVAVTGSVPVSRRRQSTVTSYWIV